MKRSIFVMFAVLLTVPLLSSAAVVYGESGPDSSATLAETTTSPQTTSGQDDSTKPAEQEVETAAQKVERETRVKKLKEVQKIRLSTTEKKKIQEKCQASQGKVSSVGSRLKGVETSRGEVHKNILNRLNTAVAKLKEKGVDTTQLEADITTLSGKIDTFNTDLASYKQSVSDLKALDCKTDPEGFKAALQTARANLEKVRTDADAVHAYLKDTLRPLLTSLKKQLETTNETQGTSGSQLNATDGGN